MCRLNTFHVFHPRKRHETMYKFTNTKLSEVIIFICLEEVYVYVHKRGHFLLTDLRNELIELENINHIVKIDLEVIVKKIISMPTTECTEDTQTFEHQLMDHYHISLRRELSNSLFCNDSTLSTGLFKAMNEFQTSSKICFPPCSQVKVKMVLNPVNWLNVLTNPITFNNLFIPGYVIEIPSSVLSSEIDKSYTLISFIAEFGGWVGLFLGVSILEGFEFVVSQISSSMTNRFTKEVLSKSGFIIKMACSLGVLIIVILCGFKLLRTKKSMDINMVENHNNVSISLCSFENIYQTGSNDTNHYYVGNYSSFWNNITKLSNTFKSIKLVLENGNSVTIYDSSWNQGSEYILYSINTLQFDTFIETCHTLDLKNWNRIKKREVEAKKELTIYVHITGQLLRSGRQGFSFMNKDTFTLYP